MKTLQQVTALLLVSLSLNVYADSEPGVPMDSDQLSPPSNTVPAAANSLIWYQNDIQVPLLSCASPYTTGVPFCPPHTGARVFCSATNMQGQSYDLRQINISSYVKNGPNGYDVYICGTEEGQGKFGWLKEVNPITLTCFIYCVQ